jgi:hypothetical protein
MKWFRAVALAGVLVAGGLQLAAPAGAGPAAPDGCGLLTPKQLSKALGVSVEQADNAQISPGSCRWETDDGDFVQLAVLRSAKDAEGSVPRAQRIQVCRQAGSEQDGVTFASKPVKGVGTDACFTAVGDQQVQIQGFKPVAGSQRDEWIVSVVVIGTDGTLGAASSDASKGLPVLARRVLKQL